MGLPHEQKSEVLVMTIRQVYGAALRRKLWIVGACLLPAPVLAQNTCNGFININYVNAGICTEIDQTVDMKISFGTGDILNGNFLAIAAFQLNLDCDASMPLTPPCTDDTNKIQYLGDGTIVTDCGVAWTTTIDPMMPNVVVFEANPPLVIPANQDTLPGFCSISFDMRKLEESSADGTPEDIEQLVGYEVAACDNGVLLSGGFQTSSIVMCQPFEDFQCYQTPRNNTTKPNQIVSVADQFGSDAQVKVVRAEDLCAPVDKNGENPGAENSPVHFVRYILDQVNGAGFANVDGVTVLTQFGDFLLDVGDPDEILVPTAKSVVPAAPPPPLAPDAADHYLCHRVDVQQQPDLKAINLTLIDQFSAPGSYAMKLARVDRLCAPASKNGSMVIDDEAHLLCFKTNPPEEVFDQLQVNLVNQFFAFQSQDVRITREQEFCVEARKMLP